MSLTKRDSFDGIGGTSEEEYDDPRSTQRDYPPSFVDGLTEYDLEKSLSDYRERFGDEKFMFAIETYLTKERLY